MKNTTEYQDLLRTLAEGGELSGAERAGLERLLAEDPEFARMYERMEQLDGLVRNDRTELLKEAKTDQLRAAVSTLSRSVPAGTAAAGMLSIGKIISGGLLLLLLAVGAWLLMDRNGESKVVVPASPETSVSVPASAESFDDEIPSVGKMRGAETDPAREVEAASGSEVERLRRGKESTPHRAGGPSEALQSKSDGTGEGEKAKMEEKQSASSRPVNRDGNIRGRGLFDLDRLKDSANK